MPKFIERFPEINSGFMKGCDGILHNIFAIFAIEGVLTPLSPPCVFSSPSACRLLTALLELGALIGSLIAGFSADKFSRKVTLGLGIFFFVVGSVIQSQSSAPSLPPAFSFSPSVGLTALCSDALSFPAASFNYGTLVAGRTVSPPQRSRPCVPP